MPRIEPAAMTGAVSAMARNALRRGTSQAIRATPRAPDVPVVLVHGILGQERLYWNLMKRMLRAEGVVAHEIGLPNLALGDMREAAVAFRTRFFELQERLGVPRMDVVAHSAGGLVVRYFLKVLTSEAPIRRLITLGTPHQGTKTASLLPELGMMRQVRPGSAFLTRLNDDDPTPGPTLYTAVWTDLDGLVVPATSAKLRPAPNVENVRLRGTTHWGYLIQPHVSRFVAREIESGFQGGERQAGRLRASSRRVA